MNGHSLGSAVRRLREALGGEAGSDAALLERFAADRDPAAFAALVARYGPLVLGVCRRTVNDPHLAEDVFQAVFLVLARKASSIRRRDAIGSWLYGVAFRLARKARSRLRFAPEPRNTDESHDPATAAAWNDLLGALDYELHCLPDRLRAPLLLCYYDGCTQDEAAGRLGWSFGTLRRRLEQARDLLRVRLTARGATLGAGLLATVLATRGARAAMPSELSRITIDAANAFAAGGRLAGAAGQLAEEGLRMVGMSKMRTGAALAILVSGLAVGSGTLFGGGMNPPEEKTKSTGTDVSMPAANAAGSPQNGVFVHHGGLSFCHGSAVINILVTPNGKTILTQGLATVRLWDAATGKDQGILELPDDAADFWTASLAPDGKTLITTRRNGTAQVWDLASRKMLRSFRMAAPPFDVTGAKCAHSPDGKAIAVVTLDGSIRVCDVTAGKEMDQLRSHSDAVTAVAFTPDGKDIVLASEGSPIIGARDVTSGKDGERYKGLAAPPVNLAFSPDGNRLAGACISGKEGNARTIISWTHWTGGVNQPNTVGGNSLAERLLVFSPDARYLFAPDKSLNGRILTQWDLNSSRAIRQYPTHATPIHAIAFTPDGRTLITPDASLRFWDWTTGLEQRPAAGGGQHCYALMPDGKSIAEGDDTGVRLWDTTTGAEVRRFDVPRSTPDTVSWIIRVAVSSDGTLIAAQGGTMPVDSAGNERRWFVWVWDAATGDLKQRLDDSPPAETSGYGTPNWRYSAITFSGNGKLLASTGANRRSVAWNTETWKEETDPSLSPMKAFRLVIDPAGTIVAGALVARPGQIDVSKRVETNSAVQGRGGRGQRREGYEWTTSAFQCIAADEGRANEAAVDFTASAERVVCGGTSRDGSGIVVVNEVQKGQEVGRVRNLPRPVARVAITPDGKVVAAALTGENPPVIVFSLDGQELKRFTGLHGNAAWLAFSPDGKRLYAASSDTTVLGWNVDGEPGK
jgi:RNA polymerase sigma factor (sigma-70 family)